MGFLGADLARQVAFDAQVDDRCVRRDVEDYFCDACDLGSFVACTEIG